MPRVPGCQPPAVAGPMQQAVCDALIAFMAATSQSQAEATRSKLSANGVMAVQRSTTGAGAAQTLGKAHSPPFDSHLAWVDGRFL